MNYFKNLIYWFRQFENQIKHYSFSQIIKFGLFILEIFLIEWAKRFVMFGLFCIMSEFFCDSMHPIYFQKSMFSH